MNSFQFPCLIALMVALSGCLVPSPKTEEIYDKPFKLEESSCSSRFSGVSASSNVATCMNHFSCLGNNVTNQNFTVFTLNRTGAYNRAVFVGGIAQRDLNIDFARGRYTVKDGQILFQRYNTEGTLECVGNCNQGVGNYSLAGQGRDLTVSFTWADGCEEKYKIWTEQKGPFEESEGS